MKKLYNKCHRLQKDQFKNHQKTGHHLVNNVIQPVVINASELKIVASQMHALRIRLANLEKFFVDMNAKILHDRIV